MMQLPIVPTLALPPAAAPPWDLEELYEAEAQAAALKVQKVARGRKSRKRYLSRLTKGNLGRKQAEEQALALQGRGYSGIS